jgi:Ankyrin repeats (many copies)
VARTASLMDLMRAIVANDAETVLRILATSPDLVSTPLTEGATRQGAKDYWLPEIGHYAYKGDTALHVAAAAYRHGTARMLIDAGANVRARNRRGAEPLHYAADGGPGSASWDPEAQAATIAVLIAAGADPNAIDNSGVAPLHRAVRTRCSAAVQALLEGGADIRRKNKSGSTPMRLARLTTGRGGSGSAEAKAEQIEIVRLLKENGAR